MLRCEPTPSVILGYKSGVPNVLNIVRICGKMSVLIIGGVNDE